MASNYLKANASNVATKDLYKDMDITFERHPITDDITVKKDVDAVKRSLKNIVLTNHFERPFKPNFGANLRARLFELNDFGMKDLIVSDIQEALVALEPRIRNVRCRIIDSDDNNVNITVFYTIINGNRSTQTDVKINRVR